MYQPFAFLNICFEGSGKTKDGKRKKTNKKTTNMLISFVRKETL